MEALAKNQARSCILHGLGYLALAVVLAGWTAGLTRKACGGEFIPPLDDTYIYLQYAREAAQGTPLEYQPGAEPTRGATSLLYPLVLAPFSRFLAPESLFWAAWGLGVLCLAGSALAVDRWAARRLGAGAGWPGGILVLLSGHFLWGTVSGMDIGIYALALTAALAMVPWYLDAGTPRHGVRRLGWLSVVLFAVGLARPEGILLAFVIALGVPMVAHAPNSRRARAILILAPIVAGGITLGANLMALGEPGGNSLMAKAIWSEQRPDVRAAVIGRLPWVFGQITRALFSDFRAAAFRHGTGHVLEAFLTVGAVWGVFAAFIGKRRGTPERLLVLVLLAALLTGLIPAGFNAHHHRYQIPYVPMATMLVVLGWWSLLSGRVSRLRLVPLLVVAALLLPGLWLYGHRVARNASNIRNHQVAVGRWIHEHLSPDAIIALNDAGAIAYYGGHRVVDLVGLVTNGSALPNRAGQGSLYEWLEHLEAKQRPTHFAIFPSWFPYLRNTTLVGQKLASFTLKDNTISGADVKAVYEADWSRTRGVDQLWLRSQLIDLWGFTVSDMLDVADLESQRAHEYEAFDTWRDTLREFIVAGQPHRILIDGGRQPSHGERFRLRCRPGQPAALIMRTEAFRPFRLEVSVDGRNLGLWEIDMAPQEWNEPLFEIPGDALTGESVLIELTQPDPQFPYPSFHYWLLQ